MRPTAFSLFLILSGCVSTQTVHYSVSINQPARVKTAEGTVCRDEEVSSLPNYKLPDLPTFTHLKDDDAQSIVDLLITHISTLRNDLRHLVRDYECSPYPE